MVKRLILAVVIALSVILPGLASSVPTVSAAIEPGCVLPTPNPPYQMQNGTHNQFGAGYTCWGDPGVRQLQVCIISGGVWVNCVTTTSGASAENMGEYVNCRFDTYTRRTTQGWVWFYGEGGQTTSKYSATRSLYSCI